MAGKDFKFKFERFAKGFEFILAAGDLSKNSK